MTTHADDLVFDPVRGEMVPAEEAPVDTRARAGRAPLRAAPEEGAELEVSPAAGDDDFAPPAEGDDGGVEIEPGALDGTQAEPEPEPEPEAEAEAERKRRSELSGKRVVFVLDTEITDPGPPDGGLGFANHRRCGVLIGDDGPQLYDGDADQARRAALDDPRNEALAEEIRKRPGKILVGTVPAASWSPEPVKSRVVQSAWAFGS